METNDDETGEKEDELTVDLSKQSLKKIERAKKEYQSAVTLILDQNEIQKLDNLESYPNLKKLSLVGNQLLRMHFISSLVHLVVLDLSHNLLVSIDGLKEITELKILKLAQNRIKTIEHLNSNLKLEMLDVSENNISRISDISYLINLKELYLHGNEIVSLTHCEKKLPVSLEVLTLNNNSLTDLNEVSHLCCLTLLKDLTLANNPCLNFSEDQKFNYRPFVKNWCCNLVLLDHCPLNDIECLKAEWLYSQGRGRSFKTGEHATLIEYLISVCPGEKEENAETEDVKKLKLILSKAQLHQQQLREQLTLASAKCIPEETFTSPNKKKSIGLSERMISSFQNSPAKDFKILADPMTQSLDSGLTRKSLKVSRAEPNQTPLQTSTSFVPIPDTLISPDVGQPLSMSCTKPTSLSSRTSRSSSRNSPLSTPENKRKICYLRKQNESSSPVISKVGEKLNFSSSSALIDEGRNLPSRNSLERKALKSRASNTNYRETSEEEDGEALSHKLKSELKAIQMRVSQRKQNKITNKAKKIEKSEKKGNFQEKALINLEGNPVPDKIWKAAVCIQRRWRGYRARNLDEKVLSGCKSIQVDRIQDYLIKVLSDMETTRIALEGNRKLVTLQMQAINALWKKTTGFQPADNLQLNEKKDCLQDLVETCSTLNKQVEALQVMMKNLQGSRTYSTVPTATQTEIVAVHTPQEESRITFPYNQAPKDIREEEKEEDHQENTFNSSDGSKTVGITEIYTYINTQSTSKTSSRSDSFDSKEFSFITENLIKPSLKLNKENNEDSPSSNELEISEAKAPVRESHES